MLAVGSGPGRTPQLTLQRHPCHAEQSFAARRPSPVAGSVHRVGRRPQTLTASKDRLLFSHGATLVITSIDAIYRCVCGAEHGRGLCGGALCGGVPAPSASASGAGEPGHWDGLGVPWAGGTRIPGRRSGPRRRATIARLMGKYGMWCC